MPTSPSTQGNLALRALDVARTQIGVAESTGRNDGQQIARYFNGCTRRSKNGVELPTGWQSGWDWCAAFASWCVYEAAKNGALPPHGRRITVWELIRDAKENQAWQDASDWNDGPDAGDLVCFKRDGDPRLEGQTGHVARCVSFREGRLVTIGGNETNRVREADVTSDLARAVGVIRYNRR